MFNAAPPRYVDSVFIPGRRRRINAVAIGLNVRTVGDGSVPSERPTIFASRSVLIASDSLHLGWT